MPHIALEERLLANGLRVVLAPDRRAPVVAVNLAYLVGSGDEEPGRTGFAHLFEHMMFQGSERVAKGQHFTLVQAAGGRANAYTGWDTTVYQETLPSHELELALWLEADRMRSLATALTTAKLDNQRDVVRNERRTKVDNHPYGTWEERLFGLAYPDDHPYHHSAFGSMEDLAAATLDDVAAFFATWYVPDNAVLTLAGDVDIDDAVLAVERHFGEIRPGDRQPARSRESAPTTRSKRENVAEEAPAARILIAHPIGAFGTDDFDAAEVTGDLLARGRGSRLVASLVRDRQLLQDVSAEPQRVTTSPALLVVDLLCRDGVEPAEAEAAYRAELERLRAHGPSDAELGRVRALRQSALARDMERAAERADLIGMHASLLGQAQGVNDELTRYAAVDTDRVRHIAERSTATSTVVTFIPEA